MTVKLGDVPVIASASARIAGLGLNGSLSPHSTRRGSGDERQLIAEVRPAGGHALTPTHALRRLLANPAGEQRPALIGLLEA